MLIHIEYSLKDSTVLLKDKFTWVSKRSARYPINKFSFLSVTHRGGMCVTAKATKRIDRLKEIGPQVVSLAQDLDWFVNGDT